MDIFGILTMVGGLALFLYGMNTMGDALVATSGSKLESVLEKLTEKRIMALLLGMLVTAVIQSSSATTVMVVGLVNSGIMKLSQAVGIIMGANIGTTVTSWILSLSGISGDGILVNMLKPSSFTPILALIGIVMIMTCKDNMKKKNIGNILLGFAVLMFGMETMSGAVAPLRDDPGFTGILTAFSNPVLGVLAGLVLTAVIQSSSASVGILQALCISGMVTYGSAIPIIMGQNIGTCVTAMISAIGTKTNAKRAAYIHLFFNLIGTTVFMIAFYTINYFVEFDFLQENASAAGIAVIHSVFNMGCAIMLYPFANQLVRFANIIGRNEDEKEKAEPIKEFATLDDRFLDTPAFALQLCKGAVERMGEISQKAIKMAIGLQDEYSKEKLEEVIKLEQTVDRFEDVVGSYLVKIARKDLTKADSHTLSVLLHAVSDFERISDHAINIAEASEKMDKQGLAFTKEGKQELDLLTSAVRDIMSLTINSFEAGSLSDAAKVEPLEEVIDDLVKELKERHISRLKRGACSMEAGLLLEEILINYERVSDHCSNIAATLIEIEADDLQVHRYINTNVKGNDPFFHKEYSRLKNVYILP